MSAIRNTLHLEIIPGILEKEWGEIEKKIESVLPFAPSIHIDVVDGIFAPNTTWMDPAPFAKYTKESIFEVHLMTDNPLQYVEAFADAGFQRFIGHVEKMPDVIEFVAKAQEWGEVGLAFDGTTEIDGTTIDWNDIDIAFFYTGERIGFSHAKLLPEKLEKVKKLRSIEELLTIEIDGGVNDTNIALAKAAGVTRFVSTGFLFEKGSPEEQFRRLQHLLSLSN